MSKKSKKELAKAEAMMAKALKMQAKAKKMQHDAAQMQLTMLQAANGGGYLRPGPEDTAGSPAQLYGTTADPWPVSAGSAPETDSGQHSGTVGRLRDHIRSTPFLYAAIGAVTLLAAIWLIVAQASRRSSLATAAAAPVVAGRGAPVDQPAPPVEASDVPTSVVVLDTWTMPEELVEISSNAFLDADRVACIQDNAGIIYTYNLRTRQVEHRLKFAKPGDFEALSVVGNTFYALRSDGRLYEVQPSGSGAPGTKEYNLPLKAEQDTEPMVYDGPNNRLLVGVKEKDPLSSDLKGIYSFDLATKTMDLKPVMTIPARHPLDGGGKKKDKKKAKAIKPSEIAIDPRSGYLYALNGPESEFLILDQKGNLKQTIQLDKSVFPQPEGMCFSPSGELYISSEGGKKGKGVIAKVELK